MILYDSGKWIEPITRYQGTVWPAIRWKCILTSIYVCSTYSIASQYEMNFGSEGRTILFGTMSFLLIFRANQAYSRYWYGRTIVSHLFSDLREVVLLTIVFLRGGASASTNLLVSLGGRRPLQLDDAFDQKAREVRVDTVRLIVALAVSLCLHTRICLDGYCFGSISPELRWRIDWDRLRLRQLLTEEEFRMVDKSVGFGEEEEEEPRKVLRILVDQFKGSMGQQGPQEPPADWEDTPIRYEIGARPYSVIVFYMRELFSTVKHQDLSLPWGLKERMAVEMTDLLGKIEHGIQHVDMIITTPVPLPYAHLCKVLLLIFCVSLPCTLDYTLGWFANTVIPSAVATALLGVDAIATELENPFGDDANDLDLLELISLLENEALDMLTLSGDFEARRRFCWRRLPEFVRSGSYKTIKKMLAFVDVVAPEIVTPEVDPNSFGVPDVAGSSEDEESVVASLGSSLDLT